MCYKFILSVNFFFFKKNKEQFIYLTIIFNYNNQNSKKYLLLLLMRSSAMYSTCYGNVLLVFYRFQKKISSLLTQVESLGENIKALVSVSMPLHKMF
jgi:hypothetical protein